MARRCSSSTCTSTGSRTTAFRFAQAEALAAHLRGRGQPFVLLGDFNDVRDSRTIELFRSIAHEVPKTEASRFTFPADDPAREIDFIWYAPSEAWASGPAHVIAETIASDHRPVVANLTLRRPPR